MAPTPVTTNPPAKAKLTLGQVIGLALLGLEVYDQQNASGGPSIFENPATIAGILGDVAVIFPNL